MSQFLEWLSGGSDAAVALFVAFFVVVSVVVVMYGVAFLQGRPISFWPPKIGEKTDKTDETQKSLGTGKETVADICEQLGIREVFPRRDLFASKYPLTQTAASATAGSTFRIIARTLFHLMSHPATIKRVMMQGGNVELCFFDPDADPAELEYLADYTTFDTLSALAAFRKHFVKWLQGNQPPGSIEIRYHQVHLLESYFGFTLNDESLAAWDLHFGRDITDKRIFLVDSTRGLGADLQKRYNKIWEQAVPKFKYHNQKISLDELPHRSSL